MARTKHAIERALMWLSVLTGTLFVAAIYLGLQSYRSVEQMADLKAAQESLVSQLERYTLIHREMGYTRFIHNFKNGILRRDVDKLRLAQRNIDTALSELDALVELNPALGDEARQLKATLKNYRANADMAARLVHRGLDPVAIDRQVKIDDGPASADLAHLADAIDEARANLRNKIEAQVDDRVGRARYDSYTAVGLLVLGAVLIWLQAIVRKQVNSLTGTQEALARIETRFEPSNKVPEPAGASWTGPVGLNLEEKIASLSARIEAQQDELLKHADALASANEELERFAYVASHDLQEPLRKIQSNVDLIGLKNEGVDPETGERLDRITRAADQMRQLIRDLLEYSRRGTRPLHINSFDLGAMIRHVAKRSDDALDVTGGRISVDIDPEGQKINGDESVIAQVFANLFENSLKYARADVPPEIDVSMHRDGDEVVVTVADNGIGFEDKHADNIFKPFIRLQGRGEAGGTGIGLSIVKRVVERHGGSVSAQGMPDRGAVFTVRLPLGTKEEKQEGEREEKNSTKGEAIHA
jgi:signal transduction histidine kinase